MVDVITAQMLYSFLDHSDKNRMYILSPLMSRRMNNFEQMSWKKYTGQSIEM